MSTWLGHRHTCSLSPEPPPPHPPQPWLFCCSSLFSSAHYLCGAQWLSQNMLIDSTWDLMLPEWFFCISVQPSFSHLTLILLPVPLTWLLRPIHSLVRWATKEQRGEMTHVGSHVVGQRNQSPLAPFSVFAPHQHVAHSVCGDIIAGSEAACAFRVSSHQPHVLGEYLIINLHSP